MGPPKGPKGAIVSGGGMEMASLSPRNSRRGGSPLVAAPQGFYPPPQYFAGDQQLDYPSAYQQQEYPSAPAAGWTPQTVHHPQEGVLNLEGYYPSPPTRREPGFYPSPSVSEGSDRAFYSAQAAARGGPQGSHNYASSEELPDMSPPPPDLYPRDHMPDQTGRTKPRIKDKRHCRDIPFLVVFLLFLIGMIINSSWAWNRGNPRRLLSGIDYKGDLCDEDYDTRYWVNPNQVYDGGEVSNPFKLINARSICLKGCPTPATNGNVSWVCDYPEGPIKLSKKQWAAQNYDYSDLLDAEQRNSSFNLQGPCYPVLFSSRNYFWTCQLESSANNASLQAWNQSGGVSVNEGDQIQKGIKDLLNKPGELAKKYVADLGHAWPVLIVCGGIAPFLLSIAFLILVRLFVGVVIWITIVLLNVAVIAVTVWFYIKSGWIGNDAVSAVIGDSAADSAAFETSDKLRNDLKIVAVVMTIITVLVVLITVVLIRRVYLAIAVLKVSAKSIAAIPSLIIYPFFPTIILGVFFIYWVSVLLYSYSAGEVRQNSCGTSCSAYDLQTSSIQNTGCCGYEFHHAKNVAWSILFHIFGGFWITQFVNSCSLTIIAGAVVSYYWVRGDTSQLPAFPVLKSTKRVFRYSLGSMAIASLLVAIIQFIRFLLEFIRKRFKLLTAAPGGCCISILCCCVQCCLGCIEWTIKFINRNAYIVIAIKGKGFFRAAAKASGLIVNNILRVGTVNIIGDFILFLGKVSVGVSSTVFAFLMLDQHRYKRGKDKVSSPLFPILFTWLFAYTVAGLFFGVVEMAIDTILLSYCIDSEENNGTPKFAPPLLVDILSKHTRSEEEIEAKKGLQ